MNINENNTKFLITKVIQKQRGTVSMALPNNNLEISELYNIGTEYDVYEVKRLSDNQLIKISDTFVTNTSDGISEISNFQLIDFENLYINGKDILKDLIILPKIALKEITIDGVEYILTPKI